MSNTYTQLHVQIIFAVENRMSLIKKEIQEQVYKYIIAIIHNHNCKVIAIGGLEDHIHILIGFRPNQSISDLVQNIKRDSSKWINQNHLSFGRFGWQEGFGAFTYGKSQLNAVINYINTQEQKHKSKTFLQEYKTFLDKFEIEYDNKYIFKEIQ